MLMGGSVSSTVDADASARSRASRWRRIMPAAVTAVVFLAGVLVTVAIVRHLDHEYGPLQSGGFGGVHYGRDLIPSGDGIGQELTPTRGATAQLIASVDNRGSHSVQIVRIDTDDVVTNIRWSVYRTVPGGNAFGTNTPWRAFPAIVPGHGTIRLLITIHRPSYCGRPTSTLQSGAFYSGYHRVYWDSLIRRHTTTIDDRLGLDNIKVC
jgi:hypothetical protein